MQRLARALVLPPGSTYLSRWTAINRAALLKTDAIKAKFLDSLAKFRKRARRQVAFYAFVATATSVFKVGKLNAGPEHFSNWVRSAHSSFALKLNRLLGRSGPVGQDRPKTTALETQELLKRVMFTLDYLPVLLGLAAHPGRYGYSSYKFFAYGAKNEWTKRLSNPPWYLELGETPEERQKAYRKMATEYHKNGLLLELDNLRHFAGEEEYVRRKEGVLRRVVRQLKKRLLAPETLTAIAVILLTPTDYKGTFIYGRPYCMRGPPRDPRKW